MMVFAVTCGEICLNVGWFFILIFM